MPDSVRLQFPGAHRPATQQTARLPTDQGHAPRLKGTNGRPISGASSVGAKATRTTISGFVITGCPFEILRARADHRRLTVLDALCSYGRFRQVLEEEGRAKPLGVDEATFAVYHALLSHPDSTPEQIAALINRPLNEVQQLMDNAP